ncbi:MAG: DUF3098 domain-containing protein, partial [Bacteroidota bacterium]|nr:DUF3098 domain-containing protein [Bacteroidota bacterium]
MEEKKNTKSGFPLGKENFKLVAIGFVIIIIGFFLMAGGKSPDPSIFSEDIFSFRRLI